MEGGRSVEGPGKAKQIESGGWEDIAGAEERALRVGLDVRSASWVLPCC